MKRRDWVAIISKKLLVLEGGKLKVKNEWLVYLFTIVYLQ